MHHTEANSIKPGLVHLLSKLRLWKEQVSAPRGPLAVRGGERDQRMCSDSIVPWLIGAGDLPTGVGDR